MTSKTRKLLHVTREPAPLPEFRLTEQADLQLDFGCVLFFWRSRRRSNSRARNWRGGSTEQQKKNTRGQTSLSEVIPGLEPRVRTPRSSTAPRSPLSSATNGAGAPRLKHVVRSSDRPQEASTGRQAALGSEPPSPGGPLRSVPVRAPASRQGQCPPRRPLGRTGLLSRERWSQMETAGTWMAKD